MIDQAIFLDFTLRTCIIWSTLFFTYKFFLSKSKWHTINRIILLLILILPFLLPFVQWTKTSEYIPQISPITLPTIDLNTIETNDTPIYTNWLYPYFIISIILFVVNGRGIIKTLRLKTEKPFFYYKNHKIYLINKPTAFNFLNQIYIGTHLKNETNILDHEIIHKQAKHSLDLIFITFLKTIFWIFPFWKIVITLFKENHEYYVDEKLLKTVKLSDYLKQITLTNTFQFKEQHALTSNQMSIFKTRLQMMKKNHKSHFWRYLLIVTITGGIFTACNKNTSTVSEIVKQSQLSYNTLADTKTYNACPTWIGCKDGDLECLNINMINYIREHSTSLGMTSTPRKDERDLITFNISEIGEVTCTYFKEKQKDGIVYNEVVKSLEILFPTFIKPAYKNGQPVPATYTFPIYNTNNPNSTLKYTLR